MGVENRILSAILHDRTAYDNIYAVMSHDDFTDHGWVIVECIKEYYDNDSLCQSVDTGWLIDTLHDRYPKHGDILASVVSSLQEVSIPNVVAEFKRLKLERTGSALSQALVQRDYQDIDKYLEKYTYYREAQQVLDDDNNFYIDTEIDSILESVQPDNLIKVYPSCLNDRLGGGVIPGTQIAIYAPTEVGKSLLSINMACGFMHDGRKVLYCGNEDPARMMLMRFYSRMSGMDRYQMIDNPTKARELAYARGYGNLVFYDMCPGNLLDIRRAVDRYKPEIIFVDQMANMETRSAFSKVEKNEYLATKLRNMSKEYGLVNVIIHQASESAYGKLVVEKNDMYYSNVGVQGQMDVMIGIGMDAQFEQQNKRMLCLTKNKIGDNHDCFPVMVDTSISKVISV